MKNIMLWLVLGTKGGNNRARIMKKLHSRPYNANQLSKKLHLNYRTISHHLNILEKNNIVPSAGENYGVIYLLSDEAEKNYDSLNNIWV
ncbi:bacterial regulatory protein, arsR family [Methanobrevibacter cuticularis]|uniref:Bacterial regulatory protein, arsR family n=1 Tax=Methanobrevibacter cuticularis TaxID=47311 RepID=A0A166F7M0_9EURY|nr:winged helix-turn-helix domain-containing protein [Methanobrevibacter cuticularis]KZX17399.1 bacterial regulatory protein, arsR family [Methanobrevibacter cuticularis]